jgi:hypothetical protein
LHAQHALFVTGIETGEGDLRKDEITWLANVGLL